MLSKYLEAKGETQADFAARVDATQATISKICAFIIVPKRKLMARIAAATDGAVTPNDIHGVLPSEMLARSRAEATATDGAQ